MGKFGAKIRLQRPLISLFCTKSKKFVNFRRFVRLFFKFNYNFP